MACTAFFTINPAFSMFDQEKPTPLPTPQKREHSGKTEVNEEKDFLSKIIIFNSIEESIISNILDLSKGYYQFLCLSKPYNNFFKRFFEKKEIEIK
jgi:hypothetical protein